MTVSALGLIRLTGLQTESAEIYVTDIIGMYLNLFLRINRNNSLSHFK